MNTYSEWKNEFLNWLTVRSSRNIPDLALSYCNRAQAWLASYDLWDNLITTATLSVDSGTLQATLPSDLDRILHIGTDSDNDGDIDIYYYKDEGGNRGYQFRNSFDKSTGVHTKTITFHEAPPSPVVIKYVTSLEEITGEGTEYLFFPKNLVLRCAQTMRMEEKGLQGNSEYVILKEAFERELKMYQENHQYVNQTYDLTPKDAWGGPIVIPEHDMMGGHSWPITTPYSRARDLG